MLAVFNKAVANGPAAFSVTPSTATTTAKCSADLISTFMASHHHPACLRFDDTSSMSYSHQRHSPLRPRSFASVDDIFCLFEGTLQNLARLRQQYGLSKTVTEVLLVIEAYRALRDRAPYPASQVVRDLCGNFAFVLYDNKTRTIFVAADSDGKVPFYWGTTSDGALAFTDDEQLMKEGCGKSFAPFPEGCYFSSAGGLQSYEHPLKEVKAIPRVDSKGQMCGSTFKVDTGKDQAYFSRSRKDFTAWGLV